MNQTTIELMAKMRILGHRGWSAQYPENTCLAFEKALRLGIDGIEFDVQLTMDEVPVVIHDAMVDRTTNGSGRVSTFSAREIQQLNAASTTVNATNIGFQPIPTLEEVIQLVQTILPHALCNIELKVHEGDGKQVVNQALRCVRRYPDANILFSSFHHECLAYLREQSSQARIGLLFEDSPTDLFYLAHYIRASSVHLDYRFTTREGIAACHERGFQVCVWTVDTPNEMQAFAEYGTDILITNVPDQALRLRRARKADTR